MALAYYRISTALSELDNLLYRQPDLSRRLAGLIQYNKQSGRPMEPRIGDIQATHRFPFRTKYQPVIISAADWRTNPTNGNRIEDEYGGEFSARQYLAIDITEGTIVATEGGELEAETILWAYCRNFLASIVENIVYRVSSDILYELTGHTIYLYYDILSTLNKAAGLARMMGETTYVERWVQGSGSTGATLGSFEPSFPYTPLQSYETTHGAFTIYFPLDLFTTSNVECAYPEVAVHSLARILEYRFRSNLLDCVNLYVGTAAAGSGLVNPKTIDATLATWTATPSIDRNNVRLITEHYVVHRDLQKIMALTPHGFLIRQFKTIVDTLTDRQTKVYAETKVVESLYFITRYIRNTIHTNTPEDVISLLVFGDVPIVYEIDPFWLPMNITPISNITLTARGQTFYRNIQWREISEVHNTVYCGKSTKTNSNNAVGLFTFAHHMYEKYHTGTYNSGYGPNLQMAWTVSAFSTNNPGELITIAQGVNMILVYKGTLTVRYT